VNGFGLPRQRLSDGARRLGIRLDEASLDKFDGYAALLAEGRQRLNLTTVVDPIEVSDKLFLDSLTGVLGLPAPPGRGARFVDVGTGAGFPGVPLAVALPNVGMTLLDATRRKIEWVDGAVRQVGIDNAWGIAGRAEDVGHHPGWRGQFDVATARAVAPLSSLAEMLLPLVRPGGIAIALKTSMAIEHEMPATLVALARLGGAVARVMHVPEDLLPNRAIVTMVRTGEIPREYPRRPGIPARYPLGDESGARN
jgi:16S rRNA (guanine527-N7)-methyltransferase